MDKRSFIVVTVIIALYALFSFSKFKNETKEYKAGNFINIDKKALMIEKKPPVLSQSLSSYKVWGVKKEEIKKPTPKPKIQNPKPKKPKNLVKVDLKSGVYNICIAKECYELLGIAKGYIVLYKNKNNTFNYLKLRKNDMIQERVKIVKIKSNEIKLFDTKDKKEFIIKYFKTDAEKYRPKVKK